MGVNTGLISMSQIAPMTDDAHAYLIMKAIEQSDVFKNALFKNDEKGLDYPVYADDGTVKAGFVSYLAGFERTFANSVTNTAEKAFKLGFNIELPEEMYVNKNLANVKRYQAGRALEASFAALDTTWFYGDGNGTTAFKGLHTRLAAGAANVLNMGGSTNKSSVYLQVFGDFDSHGYIPEGYGLAETDIDVEEIKIAGSDGNPTRGLRMFMQSYAGLVVHSALSIGQIYGIEASGSYALTLTKLHELMDAMSIEKDNRRKRAVLWMNSRTYRQLQGLCDKEIVRQSYADFADLSFPVYDGVRIAVTDAILNNESAKA